MNDKRRSVLLVLAGFIFMLAALGVVATGSAAAQVATCAALIMPPPSEAATTELGGVSATGPDGVWTVGEEYGPSRTTLISLHWDGFALRKVPMPQQPDASSQWLYAVDHAGAYVWAVGSSGTADSTHALIMRWDGTSWLQSALAPAIADGVLLGVNGAAWNDVWAVGRGYDDVARLDRPVILHWNGGEWSAVAAPDLGQTPAVLNAVSARASDDAWAVGSGSDGPLILHWNGAAWSRVDFPTAPIGASFGAVQALGPTNVWAVGRSSEGVLAAHWDGQSWQVVPTPAIGEFPSYLSGIAAVSPNDIWAVGSRVVLMRPVASEDLVVLHWDGQAWSSVPVANPGPHTRATGVAATADGAAWISGSYFFEGEQRYTGLLYHLSQGPCLTPSPALPPATFTHNPLTPSPSVWPAASPTPSGDGTAPPPEPLPGFGSLPFPETGQTVSGIFLDYWLNNGGLAQQGYPISGVIGEVSELDGKAYTVQYFERAVFEYHPENDPPYTVLLSQLGTFYYRQRYGSGAPNQRPNQEPGTVLFTETGKRLGGRFLEYWRANGGLMQQGLPISDEFTEVSPLDGKAYTVQYFERAVFEWHPENQAPYDVLLSQLGTFRWAAKYGRH